MHKWIMMDGISYFMQPHVITGKPSSSLENQIPMYMYISSWSGPYQMSCTRAIGAKLQKHTSFWFLDALSMLAVLPRPKSAFACMLHSCTYQGLFFFCCFGCFQRVPVANGLRQCQHVEIVVVLLVRLMASWSGRHRKCMPSRWYIYSATIAHLHTFWTSLQYKTV